MRSLGFTPWQDGDFWLGHLDEYPDYVTQGTSLEDLKAHLLDLYRDLSAGLIQSLESTDYLEQRAARAVPGAMRPILDRVPPGEPEEEWDRLPPGWRR